MRPGIEKAFDAAVKKTDLAAYCAGCGGLNKFSPDMVWAPLDQEPARCKVCGLIVNQQGKAVGYRDADGEVHVTVMTWEGGPGAGFSS